MDIEIIRKIVMEAGAKKLDGIQEAFEDIEAFVSFTEPVTGSQTTVPLSKCTVEEVKKAIKRKQDEFNLDKKEVIIRWKMKN